MTIDELQERRRFDEISKHAYYFVAACLMKSIAGGAELINTTPKSISNHIKWLEQFRGEKLLVPTAPGKTMKLTWYGRKLWKRLHSDFAGAIKELDADKIVDIVGESFVEAIKTSANTGSVTRTTKCNRPIHSAQPEKESL